MIEGLLSFLMAVVILATVYFMLAVQPKQPDNFDSMLCTNHVPVGTMLVTDRIINCTNGKRYVEVER
jgi:hypothetical protein